MSTNRNFDRIAEAWLANGPTELADRVLHAALREVHVTQQRRRWAAPWRTQPMPFPMRAGGAMIAIVAVAGLAALILINRGPGIGAPATQTPTATPVPTAIGPTPIPTLSLETSTWTAFTSARYGFSARYPSSFRTVPSNFAFRIPNYTGNMFDGFNSDGSVTWLYGASMSHPSSRSGVTQEAWLEAYRQDVVEDESPLEPEHCFEARENWTSVTIDGVAGDLRTGCQTLEAFAFVEDRVYLFGASAYDGAVPETAELGVSDEFRDVFETWLTTITLDPASALPGPTLPPSPAST